MQTPRSAFKELTLKTEKSIALYSTKGQVHSVECFIEKHSRFLSEHELEIVRRNYKPQRAERLPELNKPLTRTIQMHDGNLTVPAVRAGARSAFIPHLGLKLKGCRPLDATFPSWQVDADYRVRSVAIPFGVLTAEGILREVLGYCFMVNEGLQPATVPLTVVQYEESAMPGRFSLVSRVVNDERLETKIDCGGMTLHQLLRLHFSPCRSKCLGREAGLRDMDTEKYAARKSELLLRMNFSGGFRGILNSNLGNDVIAAHELFSLCDFDTFTVVRVPERENVDGVRRFVFQSFLEVIKSSLPFVDYLDVTRLDPKSMQDRLAGYYKDNSSLYRLYRAKFLQAAAKRNWNLSDLAGYIDQVFQCELSGHLLQELIPNSHSFSRFKADSWYVPHN
jgi:hypothetical protein